MDRAGDAASPVRDGAVYTLTESARVKGVSYHAVSRAVRTGKLPAQRIGRTAFVTARDLAAWEPMLQRAPKKHGRRTPDGDVTPSFVEVASVERFAMAKRSMPIAEVARRMAAAGPIEDVVGSIAGMLGQSLGLNWVTVWAVGFDGDELRQIARWGGVPSGGDEPSPSLPAPTVGALAPFARSRPDNFALALWYGERMVGFLLGDCYLKQVDDQQKSMIQAAADLLSVQIELTRLRREAGSALTA